jgi:DNA-binding CsgD family transcriptional regulator
VRGALDRCLFKLELASAVQLPLLWHALRAPGRCFDGLNGAGYLLFEVPFEALLAPLTNAERSLVQRSLEGHSYRGIAAHRGVSVRTVANQMARLFEKLEVSSRVELVVRLIELGAARAGAGRS